MCMERPTWDQYFMTIARQVSERSTCPRAKVGAVIVRERNILATGYNGAPSGFPHCTDVGCLIYESRTPYGETELNCYRSIHVKIRTIFYESEYKFHTIAELLKYAQVELVRVERG